MMCGRITEEKERDSLVLLFLTDLRPWSILLQKYLGGLVPMLSFLLLAMPLAATAYAFGGFTVWTLLLYLYGLLLACLQVGALALLCSAWFRTTVSALIGTYILGAAFYMGPLLVGYFLHEIFGARISERDCLLFAPFVLYEYNSPFKIFLCSIPIVGSIAVFLVLARVFLVRRAFLPASTFFLRLFRWLDRAMGWTNRFFGSVVVLRATTDLPEDEPIAWREMSRRVLGKTHYLVRILVAIEIPVILICILLLVDASPYRSQSDEMSAFAAVVGGLAILILSVQAANTIVSERVHQTLEVLLTTPLTAREIVAQKARVLRRFMLVLAIPLLTIFAAEAFVEHGFRNPREDRDGLGWYVIGSLLTVVVYLPLFSWFSLWIGLKMRTRFKAILTALGATVAWCAVPVFVAILIDEFSRQSSTNREALGTAVAFFSPVLFPAANEMGDTGGYPAFKIWGLSRPSVAFLTLTLSFLFYGSLLFFFRHLALSRADRYLRR
jgi:ABC-type transport system involved in multi-copper enzyme maturation permease subunit